MYCCSHVNYDRIKESVVPLLIRCWSPRRKIRKTITVKILLVLVSYRIIFSAFVSYKMYCCSHVNCDRIKESVVYTINKVLEPSEEDPENHKSSNSAGKHAFHLKVHETKHATISSMAAGILSTAA